MPDNGRTETLCLLWLPSVNCWVVIWWGQTLTGTPEAQSPKLSPCSCWRSHVKEYCPLSDTSVQQPGCSLYCEANGQENETFLLTPLHMSSRCQVQLQRRAEATVVPREAYARRYMQYLSFLHLLCHASTWRRTSPPSYGLLLGYNLPRRN